MDGVQRQPEERERREVRQQRHCSCAHLEREGGDFQFLTGISALHILTMSVIRRVQRPDQTKLYRVELNQFAV